MSPLRSGTGLRKQFRALSIATLLAVALLGTAGFQLFSDHPQTSRQIRVRTPQKATERVIGQKYHPDRVLVRYKPGTNPDAIRAIHQQVNATVLREFSLVKGLQLVRIAEGSSVPVMLDYYRRNSAVIYAEPDYIVHAVGAPNDPRFPSQWSLQNTGQSGAAPPEQIFTLFRRGAWQQGIPTLWSASLTLALTTTMKISLPTYGIHPLLFS